MKILITLDRSGLDTEELHSKFTLRFDIKKNQNNSITPQ